ncbi:MULTISPECIES: hypothetical protein [Paraburkholderia]|uniref:hypothetical protein n=1 Tax=Paraburkholderia TaxID=1822464 RepID=UPI00035D10AB|nr:MULTISPECIES: hypothetical protein [Paraburkholderia]MDH6150491.1 hypothetical protein [Paraburkholderia sp. WSM4179]
MGRAEIVKQFTGEIKRIQSESWHQQSEVVSILEGRFQLYFDGLVRRKEVFEGERKGRVIFEDGILLHGVDGDGNECVLQLLRQIPGRPPGSNRATDFMVDLEFPSENEFQFDRASLVHLHKNYHVADSTPEDILGERERETLLRQVGALAMVIAARLGRYQRGGKPNAKQIADAASEILNQLPDANRHGLSPSSIRANIKTGIDLINR